MRTVVCTAALAALVGTLLLATPAESRADHRRGFSVSVRFGGYDPFCPDHGYYYGGYRGYYGSFYYGGYRDFGYRGYSAYSPTYGFYTPSYYVPSYYVPSYYDVPRSYSYYRSLDYYYGHPARSRFYFGY